MDTGLFMDMLRIDSTSGKEVEFADFLAEKLLTGHNRAERFDVGNGTYNLLFSWGEPKVVFCSHLDTVSPYMAPTLRQVTEQSDAAGKESGFGLSCSTAGTVFYGRGTCDAKGQIFAMFEACKELETMGYKDFGLLLLAGEEIGSLGAKSFSNSHPGAEWVIVGEPTDGCMASAAKGTKAFEVRFTGEAFHSGYPQYGVSAVEMFNDFMNALRSIGFPKDDLLGDTTWNVGMLRSDNPQNILSESLSCRVYFRTTFASDEMVCNVMRNMAGAEARLRFGCRRVQDGSDIVAKDVAPWQKAMSVTELGGDIPMKFSVLEGFEAKPVSFGSDAPQLKNFTGKILFGAGSILVAHRSDEHVRLSDIEKVKDGYIRIAQMLM